METTFIELLATKSPVLVAGDDDQALYSSFRYASPEFIRALANGEEYELLDLPYCSRCTEVVVAAVNDVIDTASAKGHLNGRLAKPFACYLPKKQADSDANPKLIHVDCSTANTPYAGRYIAQQINRIPAADIATSRSKGYPTVLVIGPDPFRLRTFNVVQEDFPQARMKVSKALLVDVLDGYQRIASNDRSRLGWRIVVACSRPKGWKKIVKQALDEDIELADLLPADFLEFHADLARLVGALINDGALSTADEKKLCAALDRPIEEIRAHLALEVADEEVDAEQGETALDEEGPDILFTTLVGAKGLSAEHVFIVGLNHKYLPRDPSAIADEEICSFLVGLSRTRKRCHLISYRFALAGGLQPSIFLKWVAKHLEVEKVDKDYDFSP